MASMIRLLGYVASVLSMVNLAYTAFKIGLIPALQQIIDYYERFMQAALGWIEPFVNRYLPPLAKILNIDLHLYPHWKHVFFLMGVYFFRSAAAAYGSGNYVIAAFRVTWGLSVALASSIAAGMVLLVNADLFGNFLIATIPLIGVLLFDLGCDAWSATWYRAEYARLAGREVLSWSQEFGPQASYDFQRAAVGLVVVVAGLQVPSIRGLPSPGIVLLVVLLIVLAGYILISSARASRSGPQERPAAFRSEGSADLGTAILLSLLGALSFFALNAGLQPTGL